MKFNERLKELRLQSDIMQKDIAQTVGVSVRTFQNYEKGDIEPSIQTLVKIADVFGVTLDYLVCRDFSEGALRDSK